MVHILKLDIPDEVYETLRHRAAGSSQTLEEFVARWLSEGLGSPGEDALLRLAGVVDSEFTDVAERHDDYVGQGLAQKLKPDGGA